VHGVFGGARKHASKDAITTTLHLAGQEVQQIKVEQGEGDHGGADPVMLGYIFAPETMPEDAYARRSDHVAGGWSILTGIAANLSIARGVAVDIQEMLAAEGISL
jgi:hypothetical protein